MDGVPFLPLPEPSDRVYRTNRDNSKSEIRFLLVLLAMSTEYSCLQPVQEANLHSTQATW